MELIIFLGSLFIFLFLNIPIALVMILSAICLMIYSGFWDSMIIPQAIVDGVNNYPLMAIPFFVFAGELMGGSGIAQRLIVWAMAMAGRVPGSLGVATVGASTAIGAISGSSVATVAALGKTLYPKLIDAGYSRERAGGLLASSGAIDIVIPPSIAMIL